mmetsp:Transcript_15767/g.22424  ORF Transcript_15767/g.22424 Transcript_15767/m.22424 type:complete len:255 (+) Transcript_15767:1114-1878(+)
MPTWHYITRPFNTAFHDLTMTQNISLPIKNLLGLSLKFCPNPRYMEGRLKSYTIFHRDVHLKAHFAGESLEEIPNLHLYIKSKWHPPSWTLPWNIRWRFQDFHHHMNTIFTKRKSPSNLLPIQQKVLSHLASSTTHVVLQCDKNLGSALLDTSTYIQRVLQDHLLNSTAYKQLSSGEAVDYRFKIMNALSDCRSTHGSAIAADEMKYIQTEVDKVEYPFGTFYATIKVHKTSTHCILTRFTPPSFGTMGGSIFE